MDKVLNIPRAQTSKKLALDKALKDLIDGALSFRVFGRLAWQEIKLRYKRSTLGPFWITLSMMIMIYFMGIVYASLFKMDLTTFFPYLASGMIIWQFFLALVLEGMDCFIESEGMIKQISIPYSFYVYKVVYRNVLVAAHQIVGLIPIFFYFKVASNLPLCFLGLMLFMAIAFFGVILFGMLGARYRDVKNIVQSVLNVLFFVTPVMWIPGMLSGRKLILVQFNPVYHMLNLIRNPLLGKEIPIVSWQACSLLLVVMMGFSITLFGKYRRRIPFWL